MISIIIPLFNAYNYIDRCISGVIDQTYSDIEIIVIDDGSTDGSGDIVERYVQEDLRVHLYRQKNHGLVYSRKQGIKAAKGEYILFVDSDDYMEPDMVENMVHFAKKYSADIVATAANLRYGTHSCVATNRLKDGFYSAEEYDDIKKKLLLLEEYYTTPLLPYLWCKLWRTDVIRVSVLSADENISVAEDVAIGIPALLEAKSIYVDNKAYYHYVQRKDSMMGNGRNALKEYENAGRLYRYMCNSISGKGYGDYLAEGLRHLYVHQLLTRAYAWLVERIGWRGIFPYMDDLPQEIILYGAGEFGKALYGYLSGRTRIKAWVDRNAACCRELSYPVVTPENVEFDNNIVVIVAVLRRSTAECIYNDLIERGASADHIYLFQLTKEQEDLIMGLI